MDFEEYFRKNFDDGLSEPSKYILGFTFEAGQQSKQAEIDALKAKADICERLRDSQFDKLWNLTQAIERARVGADEDFDFFLNHLSNILKGE